KSFFAEGVLSRRRAARMVTTSTAPFVVHLRILCPIECSPIASLFDESLAASADRPWASDGCAASSSRVGLAGWEDRVPATECRAMEAGQSRSGTGTGSLGSLRWFSHRGRRTSAESEESALGA